jgi:hypothetical protein
MEPITVIEAKRYMRIDITYLLEDEEIAGFITTARQWCEKYTGLSFIAKQLEIYSDKGVIDIPYGPITSIVSVKDEQGTDITYRKAGLQHPRIFTDCRAYITVKAGYTEMPEQLKTAVKMLTATLYENREDFVTLETSESIESIPFGVKSLLQPFSRSGGLFL